FCSLRSTISLQFLASIHYFPAAVVGSIPEKYPVPHLSSPESPVIRFSAFAFRFQATCNGCAVVVTHCAQCAPAPSIPASLLQTVLQPIWLLVVTCCETAEGFPGLS